MADPTDTDDECPSDDELRAAGLGIASDDLETAARNLTKSKTVGRRKSLKALRLAAIQYVTALSDIQDDPGLKLPEDVLARLADLVTGDEIE